MGLLPYLRRRPLPRHAGGVWPPIYAIFPKWPSDVVDRLGLASELGSGNASVRLAHADRVWPVRYVRSRAGCAAPTMTFGSFVRRCVTVRLRRPGAVSAGSVTLPRQRNAKAAARR